ncbi:MAG: hypothetical protein ACRD04_03245 [Terriglobales bacterium]
MSFSLAVWVVAVFAYAAALVATFRRGVDRSLLCLRWYFALALCGNLCSEFFLFHSGFTSVQYFYAYYLTDLADVVLGFIVLARLVELAFEKSALKLPKLRLVAILLFTGIAVGSVAVVYLSRAGQARSFETLEQNFSFLGMLMAVILFVAMNLMLVPGLRFRRTVLAFSILYSSSAIAYSLEAVLPSRWLPVLGTFIVPVVAMGSIGLICYSLWQPEAERKLAQRPVALPEGLKEAASW